MWCVQSRQRQEKNVRKIALFLMVLFLSVVPLVAQSPNATINGLVFDPSGGAIVGAEVVVVNDATGVQYTTKTNGEGIYVVPNLLPGSYRIQVSNPGFKTIIKPNILIHVQDALAINFTLPIGATSEVVTVSGGAPVINTESAAVSTIVDRHFAENLPMNGRSFQTLIELTPGIALTPSFEGAEGQFSVNGQRTASNNWMVDGVSANVGMGANSNGGNGVAGALGSFSVLGGTNSLVSIDAMQEFRIQTSTYAPEFGRTPGAQISIVTRSGTNELHGAAFDYLRNSDLDANNWFANEAGLLKPAERQNDFGGTLGGPLKRDRTFFFFSYEGLRLRLPQTTFTTVPDITSRQDADPTVQLFLNAYPLPNGADDEATGIAVSDASYSNPASLNAYGLRVDHKLSGSVSLFGRYNYSPSNSDERGASTLYPLSDILAASITTQTATAGVSWVLSPFALNDFRFNFSKTSAFSSYYLDAFGGAIPPGNLPFPESYSTKDALFFFTIYSLSHPYLSAGTSALNVQHQINLVDNLATQKGTHNLKFGVDYRRLTPSFKPALYVQQPFFLDIPSAEANNLLGAIASAGRNSTLLLQNIGIFGQDTWRLTPHLILTYGLRWDFDLAPSSIDGAALPAVTGYDLSNLSNLGLAPSGTPPFATTFANLAPRLGLAYQFSQSPRWSRVFRGGIGLFYDLATSQVGDAFGSSYPFGALKIVFGPLYGGTSTFPLSSTDAAPPPITADQLSSSGETLRAFDPRLRLPYTLEWNVGFQQQLGADQSLSATYVGSVGRKLIQSTYISAPNQAFYSVDLIGNTASSDYDALQLQFQRRLSHGLQALASYTWSHSIDDGSNGSYGIGANSFVPAIGSGQNRGPSDFDIRSTFSAALTYDIPASRSNVLTRLLLQNWSLENVLQARSAPPVNVYYSNFAFLSGAFAQIRPDAVPASSFYLYGEQYPGGKAINAGAFVPPPLGSDGNPARQGNVGRNSVRGFGATQWDLAVHREFQIRDSLRLQFRAEMFNVLNHPNFGPPIGDLRNSQSINPQFGLSTQTLGQYLGNANAGGGGLSALYQIGGPRSIQLALKLMF
jgi:Carboxypeptidase regulatory-like domain